MLIGISSPNRCSSLNYRCNLLYHRDPIAFVTTVGTVVRMSYHKIVHVNLTELGCSYEPIQSELSCCGSYRLSGYLERHDSQATQERSHLLFSGVPRGGVWGVQTPPQNSEDIGGVLDHISKKNRRLDFHLQFTVFSYGCSLLNKDFF